MTDPDPMPVPTVPGQPGPKLARAVLVACLALCLGAAVVNVLTPMEPAHLTHIQGGTP